MDNSSASCFFCGTILSSEKFREYENNTYCENCIVFIRNKGSNCTECLKELKINEICLLGFKPFCSSCADIQQNKNFVLNELNCENKIKNGEELEK